MSACGQLGRDCNWFGEREKAPQSMSGVEMKPDSASVLVSGEIDPKLPSRIIVVRQHES